MEALLYALASLSFDDLCRRPERLAAYTRAGIKPADYFAQDEAAFARELLRRKGFELPDVGEAESSFLMLAAE